MTLNTYLNRFRSVKRSNFVMSWNTWDILTALFPVLCVFQRNKMASMVENASWKPLEIWFPRLLISKYPYMPRPSRTCAFGANPACHLKTFSQPCSIHHIIMYFLIYSRLVTSVEQCWYLCSGPCLNSVNYWKWFSFQSDGQIDSGSFHRPIMAHSQILVQIWGPRAKLFKAGLR